MTDLIGSRAAIFANYNLMQPQLNTNGANTPRSSSNSTDLTPDEAEIISHISHLYTGLEYIVSNDATNLTNAGKANIRRAQGDLQKLRLKMLDFFKRRHSTK